MRQLTTFSAQAIVLPERDIDTNQIIPARFLKVTDKKGLGDKLFCDWRYDADGAPVADFALNAPDLRGAQILVAGHNFGCGSSREHAPWALCDWGFRAVVSTGFADIFRSNALKNGLLPIEISDASHEELLRELVQDARGELAVDLPNQLVTTPSGERVHFPVDPFSKQCLIKGVDQLGWLLGFDDAITRYEAAQ